VGGKEGKRWQQVAADFFDLPHEIILDLPRLTVIGKMQCLLENHRGVIEYTSERVRVAVNDGEIVIRGESLVIRCLASEEITIDGTICSIHYEG